MTTSMNRRRNRAIIVGGLGLLVAAHGAGWLWAAGQMRLSVDQWVADQRAAGMTVTHGDLSITGYPFFLRAHAPDVSIAAAEGWRWSSGALDIDLTPIAPTQLTFRPRGAQLFYSEGTGAWAMDAQRMKVVLAWGGDLPWKMTSSVGGAQLSSRANEYEATLQSLKFTAAPHPDNPEASDFVVRLDALSVETARGVMDAPLLDTEITARLSEGDEALLLRRFNADVEGTNAVLSGVLMIDAAGYAQGVIDADIEKPAGLARVLGKLGALPVEDAALAEAGLAMASLAQGGRIQGPIVFADGAVSMAGVKLGEMAPVISR